MQATNPQIASIRLLIIEDDPDQRDLLREVLADRFGPDGIVAVSTCAAALGAELAGFDLILCDYHLPDGNGLDLLASLRQRCPSVPVMMLTGQNDSDTARGAIQRGATDYVVKAGAYLMTIPLTVEKNIVAGRLQRERESVAVSLQAQFERLQVDYRHVEELAATDPMTGCYNRRAFQRVLEQLFAEAQRTDADLTCVMIDLDNFKGVNDVHGHAAGDELIRTGARSIRGNLRQMDVACRYGGDEFVVLLPKADAAQAAAVAERIRLDYATASASVLCGEGKTMSVGVASWLESRPRPGRAEALVALADCALYQAKESGRDRICAAA